MMSPLHMLEIDPNAQHGVAAVILAAGRSTRFGTANKLLSDVAGKPMIARVVETVRASGVDIVHVVVGHESDKVKDALRHLDITLIDNPHYEEGMSSSVAAGIESLPATVGAAFVVLGDMPLLSPAVFTAMLAARRRASDAIMIPSHKGKRGNPVLWPRRFFDRLVRLQADSGGRALFKEFADQLSYVEVATDAILMDVDTAEALNAARERSDV
ncbi:nucleotidyltransferase family protein [Noviherbaspirillum sp.]|uniref:nucleotidyltransferase family protein n=1 Tax=Noviherbaspirillum sp. TaxID=1926288 RepID=UPI0025D831CC|nr:nucleotidyltransferase family protein [Noviherbaspirillum sp.]